MDLNHKKVTLVGLGRSSVAAAQLLRQHGACPFITEHGNSVSLTPWCEQCTHLKIPFETGGHSDAVFQRVDLVVLSPGVPPAASRIMEAQQRGIPVIGELELAWRFCTAKGIAVTGTNGKTTVTTLLRDMIAACGHSVALAGNNDTPLSTVVMAEKQPDWVVLEVSSYQLETVDQFHPAIACVLNVTPDHLSRHGTIETYAAVKGGIFRRQGAGDVAVLNADDPRVASLPVPENVRRLYFSMKDAGPDTFTVKDSDIYFGRDIVAACKDNPLPGSHNLANVVAALTVVHAGGFDWQHALEGLRNFKGVEHRIEHVMCLGGVNYYNDSKATNIDSLRVALESFSRPIVLLAGGRGKGSDYSPLCSLVAEKVKHLVVFGEDASQIAEAYGKVVSVEKAVSMMDAVRRAYSAATTGDVVLLSPACASFDMYDNFEVRGRDYKDCLRRLTDEINTTKEVEV